MPVDENLLSEGVFDQLRRALVSDPDLLTAIYRDFLGEARKSLSELETGIANAQAEAVRSKAHYLKSSCMVLGMRHLWLETEKLEKAAQREDRELYVTHWEQVKRELERVETELVQRLGRDVLPDQPPTA